MQDRGKIQGLARDALKSKDSMAYYLWAAEHDPGSIDGAVGYELRAQEMHDIAAIRQLIRACGIGARLLKED